MQKSLLSDYRPQGFFTWFELISRVPRESCHEQAITDFLMRFAEERDISCEADGMGNVMMMLAASSGYETQPALLLQAHADMVCVKDEGVDFDFSSEPIRMRIDGNMLCACGTSLGADNAVGMATMLAIADDGDICHPRLELLFTVQEEVEMQGIRHYDLTRISARHMINLDSGYTHEMCVCGAGAAACVISENMQQAPVSGWDGLTLEISGGLGGHTGVRIHRGRACAANLTGELLDALLTVMPIRLASIFTPDGTSSILGSCKTEFYVSNGRAAEARILILDRWGKLYTRYRDTDPDVCCTVDAIEVDRATLDLADTKSAVALLYLLHTGAQKHDGNNPAVVVASSSICHAALKDGTLEIFYRIRSIDDTIIEMLVGRYSKIVSLLGMTLRVIDRYPGWPLRTDSVMQRRFIDAHKALFGYELAIEYMHAGVEVGVVVGGVPDMDAIGISPTATGAHTTKEALHLDEVEPFWKLLLDVLKYKE